MTKQFSQKQKAWILYEAGNRTSIALQRAGKIPKRSADRYLSEFRSGGSWERNAYSPRAKTKSAPRVARKVIQKSKRRTKVLSTRQIGASVGISHTLVQKILKSEGISYQAYGRRLLLTEERKRNRVKFARLMQRKRHDWASTIITDEASFWVSKSRPGKVWTTNPEKEIGAGVHGLKVHCWGGISARGALTLEIFSENLDSEDYLKILRRKIPEIQELYPDGWYWQQDGSGVHRALSVKDFVDKEMPRKLDWPPYSPDLSPIENVWGWLKAKVARDAPRNVYALKRSIRTHWQSMDIEFLAPYFQSMPERMAMVIESEGAKIKY